MLQLQRETFNGDKTSLLQIGVYGFSVVSILGTFGDYSGTDNVLDTVASILEIVQSTIQTAFLVDASKRVLFLPLHINGQLFHDPKSSNLGKPAREMIMFLLANNFAQWALNVSTSLAFPQNLVVKGR